LNIAVGDMLSTNPEREASCALFATTNSSNAQLLNSLLKTLNVDSKTNGFVKMDLQKRAQEASLSGLVDNMSPTAIFNRFDLTSYFFPKICHCKTACFAFLEFRIGVLSLKD
jgi:hypothetical protein